MRPILFAVVLSAFVGTVPAATELPLDVKPAALEVYGLRGAYAIDEKTIIAIMGASGGRVMGQAEAWRITSEEDPAYAYENFIRPTGAWVRESPEEFALPTGFTAPDVANMKLYRHKIQLTLPTALKPGCRYGLVAQGINGDVNSAAKSGTWFSGTVIDEKDAVIPADRFAADVVGFRRVSNLGDGKIMLEFGAGFSEAGGNDLSAYHVTVNGSARGVVAMGRRSRPDSYVHKAWPLNVLRLHDIVLDLGAALNDGDAVAVTVDEKVTAGVRERSCVVGAGRSRAVQLNQVGYLPNGTKVGYLGCWLGSYPDVNAVNAVSDATTHSDAYKKLPSWALRFDEPPAFYVENAATGERAWTGRAKLRAAGDAPLKNAMGIRMNMSSLNVYELDFSAFTTPGRYRVRVEGVGRSFDFDISENAYVDAFKKVSLGVYAQRCGMALDPALADGWRRIACHKDGIVATSLPRWETSLTSPAAELPNRVEYVKDKDGKNVPKVIAAHGGHHDAGDYNPRAHIDVAQRLFWAYELAPKKFYDGQLSIPESRNGIPDIIDEAMWAVRLWEDLQEEDGGVYDGTESRGDPALAESVELDTQGDYAFAKDSRGSFWAAGAFATASRLLAKFGKDERAAELLAKARKAYAWAKANPPTAIKNDEQQYNAFYTDPMLYAAAEMFHTTKEESYHNDFLDNCVWRDQYWTEMEYNGKWDRRLAAQSYLLIPRAQAHQGTWDAVFAAMKREADYNAQYCEQRDYPFITQPWVGIFWGFAAYQRFIPSTVTVWYLGGDKTYLNRIIRNCDNTLGANPMSLSWIVDIGTETVRAPLHSSHWRPDGKVVAGIECEGPVYQPYGTSFSYCESCYPEHRDDRASMNAFADVHFAVEMDEGVVNSQAETMAVFGLLCPDAPDEPVKIFPTVSAAYSGFVENKASFEVTLDYNLKPEGTPPPISVSCYYGATDAGATTEGWTGHVDLGEKGKGTSTVAVDALQDGSAYYVRFAAKTEDSDLEWSDPIYVNLAGVSLEMVSTAGYENFSAPLTFKVCRPANAADTKMTVNLAYEGAEGLVTGLPESVTLSAGVTETTVSYRTVDNAAAAGNASFTVSIVPDTGYVIGGVSSASVLIYDDETAGANIVWTGGAGNGLWSDVRNWNPNRLPTVMDTASFAYNTIGSGTITVDCAATARKISFPNGDPLTFSGSGTLTLGGIDRGTAGSPWGVLDLQVPVAIYSDLTGSNVWNTAGAAVAVHNDLSSTGNAAVLRKVGTGKLIFAKEDQTFNSTVHAAEGELIFDGEKSAPKGVLVLGGEATAVKIPWYQSDGSTRISINAFYGRNLTLNVLTNGLVDLPADGPYGGVNHANIFCGGELRIPYFDTQDITLYAGGKFNMAGGWSGVYRPSRDGTFATIESGDVPAIMYVKSGIQVWNEADLLVKDGAAAVDLELNIVTDEDYGGKRISPYVWTKSGAGTVKTIGISSTNQWPTTSTKRSFTVSAGTALADNPVDSFARGGVTVNSGATLGGIGRIYSSEIPNQTSVTVNGTLAPGSIDTLTGNTIFGALTVGATDMIGGVEMNSGSKMKIKFGPARVSDKLEVFGSLNINASNTELILDADDLEGLKGGEYVIASATGGIKGTFSKVTVPEGVKWRVSYRQNEIVAMLPLPGFSIRVK